MGRLRFRWLIVRLMIHSRVFAHAVISLITQGVQEGLFVDMVAIIVDLRKAEDTDDLGVVPVCEYPTIAKVLRQKVYRPIDGALLVLLTQL